jgi:hypothetical protein
MSAKSFFKTLNNLAILEAKCGIPSGKGISFAQDQIRVDLHSLGYTWGRLKHGVWESGGFEDSDSYEGALQLLNTKISSKQMVSNGQVLQIHLWPSNVQIQPIHQQLSQKYQNLTELDISIQVAPSQLNLTQGFIYRTLEKKADRSLLKNGDLIGIPVAGIERIEKSLPIISKVGRYWGALSVLQAVVNRFSNELPESVLIGIIDLQRIHYFSIRKLQISGLRSSVRSSLRDTGDLHSTITSMGNDTSCLLFINLTTQIEDLQKMTEDLEKNKKWTVRTMGRSELVQAFPELNHYINVPLFPLSLLLDRHSNSACEIPSLCFVTPSEAMTPQITSSQGTALKTSRLFKIITASLTFLITGTCGYQIFKEISSDAWTMRSEDAQKIRIQYEQFLQDSQEYQKKFQSLTSFPRFDQLAEPLFETFLDGVALEEIRFSSKPALKNTSLKNFEIQVQGSMVKADLLKLRTYAQKLESQLQESLSDFNVTVNDSGLSEKSNANNAVFRLNIRVEVKSNGSI